MTLYIETQTVEGVEHKGLMDDIKRHLSIIGKRLYTKEGKNLFSNITLSSAEDFEIMKQYIVSAVQDIAAFCRQMLSSYTVTGNTIVLVLVNSRAELNFDNRCEEYVKTYSVMATLAEYLSMTHPELAEKYKKDAMQAIESLVEYVFYKKPPVETFAFTNPSGTVS